MDMEGFWTAVLRQDREALAAFFAEDARISWHNTNEQFTAAEYIRVNCGYPGQWEGKIERILEQHGQIVTVTHVYDRERTVSCHAVSFFRIEAGKIQTLDEYWTEDGAPPRWRQEMQIGRSITGGTVCTM